MSDACGVIDGSGPLRCAGRTVLVTGAAGAIGGALVRRLCREGAGVVMIDRKGAALEQLYDEVTSGEHYRAAPIPAIVELDITTATEQTFDALVDETLTTFESLTNVVHCAGILRPLAPLEHVDCEDLDASLAVYVQAPYRLTRACIGALRRATQSGTPSSIVFTSAGLNALGLAYWSAYAACAGAIDALALVLENELSGPPRIAVSVVDPGNIRSPFQATAFPGRAADTAAQPETIIPIYLDRIAGAPSAC